MILRPSEVIHVGRDDKMLVVWPDNSTSVIGPVLDDERAAADPQPTGAQRWSIVMGVPLITG